MKLVVAGRGGVPADAAAVALNIAVAETQGSDFGTVCPCDQPSANASTLNYSAGSVIANSTIAKIGTDGKACLFTSNGTRLVADLTGYFPADNTHKPMTAGRLLGTRLKSSQRSGSSALPD